MLNPVLVMCSVLNSSSQSSCAIAKLWLALLGKIGMKNPLTFRIESWFGSVIVLIVSAFLVGWFLIAVRNFNSDTEILNSSSAKLRTVSPVERSLIDQWLQQDNIGISASEVGYRYIIQKFPDKPWVTK